MPFLDEVEAAIPGLRAYARALLRDREAADDLVQDTLETALARRGQWRGEGSLRGWLCRILLNRFRDGLRRARPTAAVLALVPEPADPLAERKADGRLALAEVHQAGLFRITGLPNEELPKALEIAAPNVLLPFARQAVNALVESGGFPQLLINPVNFEALYQQKHAATPSPAH